MATSAEGIKAPAGFLLVDKPAGMTSHDVVARARRIFGTRKIGHAGTLDPMATGVLVLGVNAGTRLLGHLSLADKSYVGTIRLGAASSTDDREGELGLVSDSSYVSPEAIEEVLVSLRGEIMQRPSSVSAIKVNGQRAYARVRDGQLVELPERKVSVYELDVVGITSAGEFMDIDICTKVSSGTYIRAIARDLGESLGVGGHLTSLRRTAIGPFNEATCHNLEGLEALSNPWVDVLPLAEIAEMIWQVFTLTAEESMAVRMGQRISWPEAFSQPVIALIDSEGELAALSERRDSSCSYIAVFPGGVRSPSNLRS
jgi:tRNA pseudouridine55 synthase